MDAHKPRVLTALFTLCLVPLAACIAGEVADDTATDRTPEPTPVIEVTVAKPPAPFFVIAPDAGPTTVPETTPVVMPADPTKHPGPLPPECPNCPDPRGLPTEPPIELPR